MLKVKEAESSVKSSNGFDRAMIIVWNIF